MGLIRLITDRIRCISYVASSPNLVSNYMLEYKRTAGKFKARQVPATRGKQRGGFYLLVVKVIGDFMTESVFAQLLSSS